MDTNYRATAPKGYSHIGNSGLFLPRNAVKSYKADYNHQGRKIIARPFYPSAVKFGWLYVIRHWKWTIKTAVFIRNES